MGSKMPRPGVQDDQAENRVRDMDDEGTDVHFLIPTSWLSLVGLPDPALEIGAIRAYHRHMSDFCGQYPTRLKSMIVASTRVVDEAVREIREWGKSKWAVAVMPLLAKDLPADHPDLALLSWLRGPLGEYLPQPARRSPLGRHAVCRFLHRRRPLRQISEAADGGARVRFWLAAVLGPAHGRTSRLCWRHGPTQAEAQRIHGERPVLLQHRAPRRGGHVQLCHPFPGRRCPDVRLRLSALGMPIPRVSRQHHRLVHRQRGYKAEAPLRQREPLLQTGVTPPTQRGEPP